MWHCSTRIQPRRAGKKIKDKPAQCREQNSFLRGGSILCGITPLMECRIDERPQSDKEPDKNELKGVAAVPCEVEWWKIAL
jgi:hypothetical protein